MGLSILALALAGCQTTTQEQRRQDAQQHWSQVRAKVKRQLATQQYESGYAQAAVLSAEEALGLDPNDVETYVVLIRALLEAGDLSAAERALKSAEAMGLDSAELAYMRGVVAERTRRLSSALESYRRARQLDPTQLDYVVAEAECLVAQRQPEEARQTVLQALDEFDRDGTLDALLAEISLVLGDDELAATALRRALPLLGPRGLAIEEFGLILVRLGRYAEALSVFKPLIEDSSDAGPSGAVTRGAARCYLEVNRPADAGTLMRGWLRDHPADAAAWLLKAQADLAAGDAHSACRSAETAARLAPKHSATHLVYGYACYRTQRLAQAQSALQRALALSPDDALAQHLLTRVQTEMDQTDQASRHRAHQLDPLSVWANG